MLGSLPDLLIICPREERRRPPRRRKDAYDVTKETGVKTNNSSRFFMQGPGARIRPPPHQGEGCVVMLGGKGSGGSHLAERIALGPPSKNTLLRLEFLGYLRLFLFPLHLECLWASGAGKRRSGADDDGPWRRGPCLGCLG